VQRENSPFGGHVAGRPAAIHTWPATVRTCTAAGVGGASGSVLQTMSADVTGRPTMSVHSMWSVTLIRADPPGTPGLCRCSVIGVGKSSSPR
jgi:hypothetical protein